MLERIYERATPYAEEEIDGRSRRKGETSARTERNMPYLVRDGIIVTVDGMKRDVDAFVRSQEQSGLCPGR